MGTVSLWKNLRLRIREATDERGKRAALARKFKVTPQAVSEWLSGASAPTAETTLRLLKWVTKAEGKQQKGSGSVSTTAEAKTRRRKSRNENLKSGRRKK